MKLGVDNFSLRFCDWDAFQLLDYSHRIGLEVVHFSDLAPFKQLDTGYLNEVKQHAHQLGQLIEVGMGSICPTSNSFSDARGSATEQLTQMLHIAAHFNSPAVRCFLGNNADRRTGLQGHIDATIATCQSVRALALDLGIKIAIENHAGDMQGRELAALIEQAGPEYVGACIDAGNPLWVGESPFTALEHLAPYVVMSHIRDTAVWQHLKGAVAQWVPMGAGNVDIAAWAEQYIALCPNTNFTLEIIATLAPRVLNYLEEEYWELYPVMPAHEFARFLRHVQMGSAPTLPMHTADWGRLTPEIRAALAIEQQRQLEASVRYCREHLHIGLTSVNAG
jgi:sugar phosphate isomerase/epimerase